MKRLSKMLVGILACASLARADEPKPVQDLSASLEQLEAKLEHVAQRANQPNASGSSVIGLRGSKQEPLSKQLYWKGKPEQVPVTPEEVRMFRTAIEQAKSGDRPQAVSTLHSFVEKYPKSGFKGDAEDTLQLLVSAH